MKVILPILLLCTNLIVFAQHSIQSTILDVKNNSAIEMATVRLLKSKDSTLVQGAQSNMKGDFILSRIKPGNYILIISSVGYNEYVKNITMQNKDIILKSIFLSENVKLLKEVEVKGTAAQMVVKGDTMEYNASAFKTAENAVVEDLLKKMPGVEVSADGKITVNGQEIKKVRVDGKKFFGDDVEMTTKNLTADMIDKIQVLEQKSDAAKLTGFEDDNTERIINLTLKPNRRKGIFGNVSAGAGVDTNNDTRYDGNTFLNIMNGNAQTAITGGANNTNTTRSSRGRFGSGGPSGGITETQNIGINNNTEVNSNLKIGGDASFTHSNNFSETETNKISYISGINSNDSTYSISRSNQNSAYMRLESEWKIDSLRTLIIQPNFNYTAANSYNSKDYDYYTDTNRTSWGNSENTGKSRSTGGGLNVIYNKKSTIRAGRTYTTTAGLNFSQSTGESYNYSLKNTSTTQTIVDQFTQNNSDKFNYNLTFSWVEPLWNKYNMIEASLAFRSSLSNSDKAQFNKDSIGDYKLKDSVYSNNFKNNFYSETAELNYRYKKENFALTLGLKGEPSQTYSFRLYDNGTEREYKNEVVNYSPNGRFQYNFGKKEFARIDYRGSTDQPSISQMQPVKNNSNLMNETVGNPDLKPSFSQSLRLMYSKFNDKSFSSFNIWLMGAFTKDALVTNSIYDETNKQYSQTVNANELPFNLNGNIMFNTPLIAKLLHFNTSTSASFNRRYGYTKKNVTNTDINTDQLQLGDLSNTGTVTADEQISLTFTHEVIEMGARGGLRYSNTKNNLSLKNSTTYDWSLSGNLVLHLPYSINISSDLRYTTRSGYSSFDMDETIWNASIDKTLFKGKGVLALKWNDILKQQLNIRQIIGDNYISYNKYNTLTSYVMLSFSYKINDFKGGSRGGERGFRGPGGYGGMGSGGGGRRPEF